MMLIIINKYALGYVHIAKFEDSGIQFHQYNFVNSGKSFCQFQYKILSIPVYNFVNPGIQFLQFQRFWQVEMEDA